MTERNANLTRPGVHRMTAGILLVVGTVYGAGALHEGVGTPSDTGAGFFPLIVAVVLTLSSMVVLAQEHRSRQPDVLARGDDRVEPVGDDEGGVLTGEETTRWSRVAGVVLAALSVPLLAEIVGFVAMLSAAVAVIARIAGVPGWVKPCALGVAFGALAWLTFVYWLFVPLPAGVLGLA